MYDALMLLANSRKTSH